MSMIEDMTREMQALREQMDQIKGVSTNVPTDNKFEINTIFCTSKYFMQNNVKGVNYGYQIIIFLFI
jgi:hypothetical protein